MDRSLIARPQIDDQLMFNVGELVAQISCHRSHWIVRTGFDDLHDCDCDGVGAIVRQIGEDIGLAADDLKVGGR
jgi:hypothetical protein